VEAINRSDLNVCNKSDVWKIVNFAYFIVKGVRSGVGRDDAADDDVYFFGGMPTFLCVCVRMCVVFYKLTHAICHKLFLTLLVNKYTLHILAGDGFLLPHYLFKFYASGSNYYSAAPFSVKFIGCLLTRKTMNIYQTNINIYYYQIPFACLFYV
jgi:hypothetical protein